MIIKSVNGKSPSIPSDCYIAENATIVGEVTLGQQCSIWFNAVLRGDVNFIKIGLYFDEELGSHSVVFKLL